MEWNLKATFNWPGPSNSLRPHRLSHKRCDRLTGRTQSDAVAFCCSIWRKKGSTSPATSFPLRRPHITAFVRTAQFCGNSKQDTPCKVAIPCCNSPAYHHWCHRVTGFCQHTERFIRTRKRLRRSVKVCICRAASSDGGSTAASYPATHLQTKHHPFFDSFLMFFFHKTERFTFSWKISFSTFTSQASVPAMYFSKTSEVPIRGWARPHARGLALSWGGGCCAIHKGFVMDV